MSDPTTTYRGHVIRWSDNGDEWVCFDLSDKVRSSSKLSLIKAAIDRLYLVERKNDAIDCYELDYSGGRTKSSVVEYLGPKHNRSWSGHDATVEHKVAVVAKRTGSERPSRRQTKIDILTPVSDEVETAWTHYRTLQDEADAATKRAKAAHAAIPRLTVDDIRPIIELYERDQDQHPAK